ncbi:MAG: hypothetical protein KAT71_00125 [Gammaproteobacteria bacterium]|nr:hypothetical protein [Gammaproteobacteria bacterium]
MPRTKNKLVRRQPTELSSVRRQPTDLSPLIIYNPADKIGTPTTQTGIKIDPNMILQIKSIDQIGAIIEKLQAYQTRQEKLLTAVTGGEHLKIPSYNEMTIRGAGAAGAALGGLAILSFFFCPPIGAGAAILGALTSGAGGGYLYSAKEWKGMMETELKNQHKQMKFLNANLHLIDHYITLLQDQQRTLQYHQETLQAQEHTAQIRTRCYSAAFIIGALTVLAIAVYFIAGRHGIDKDYHNDFCPADDGYRPSL